MRRHTLKVLNFPPEATSASAMKEHDDDTRKWSWFVSEAFVPWSPCEVKN